MHAFTGEDFMSECVLYEKNGKVVDVTLNRPNVYNAMNIDLFRGIKDAMDKAGRDPEVRVVRLRGAGKAWCSGGDLGEVLDMLETQDVNEFRAFLREGLAAMESVKEIAKPVIAVVHGACVGGGNELNACCDLTIATPEARFGQAGPRIGSVPILLHQTLAPQIGDKRAREVTFLCKLYSAEECLAMGWINKVVPKEELEAAVEDWTEQLINKSPTALAIAKKMHNFSYEQGKTGLAMLHEMLATYWRLDEPREGMRAFLEKRPPEWSKR